jgi:transcriptional regulator with XRE-family HTH domain
MSQISLYTEKEILSQLQQSLRSRRVAVGFTQAEAARRAGLSPRTVQNLETRGVITLYNLLKLLFVYRMEHKIIDAFKDRDWWKMDEVIIAEKNTRVRKNDK